LRVKLSIIIPTFNRGKSLGLLLKSLNGQINLNDFEVIVVDNGSTDNTRAICDQFLGTIPLIYSYNKEPGLLTGRHAGAEIASGKILTFLDDDVELTQNYTQTIIDVFENFQDVDLATGPSIGKYEAPIPDWFIHFWTVTSDGEKYCTWLSLMDLGNREKFIHPNFIWGLNFSIRKHTFLDLGGFHPDCIPQNLQQFQGDGETGLTIKAFENNYKALYHPKIRLYHNVSKERLTLNYLKKRAYYQGVCDSYTDLRLTKIENNRIEITSTLKKITNKLHPCYRWIRKIIGKRKAVLPIHVLIMQNEINTAKREGYNFHQKAFRNDSIVREWVLRENYWDYKLPLNGRDNKI